MIPASFPDCETACLCDRKYLRELSTDRLIVYMSEKKKKKIKVIWLL